jgi:hypothetical protein
VRRLHRVLPLALVALAIAVPSLAQDGGFGVKGGVNLADEDLSGSGAPSTSMRVAAVAGGFVTLPLGSWLALQAEGLYTMKGAKVSVSGIDSTLQIDYLEVPLLARVRLGSGPRHYYVAGGVAPAFRMRARAATTFSTSTEELDVSDQVERFDLGVAAGGGMQSGPLVIDARYTLGLRDIDTDKTDGSKTKNRTIAVTVGFRF